MQNHSPVSCAALGKSLQEWGAASEKDASVEGRQAAVERLHILNDNGMSQVMSRSHKVMMIQNYAHANMTWRGRA